MRATKRQALSRSIAAAVLFGVSLCAGAPIAAALATRPAVASTTVPGADTWKYQIESGVDVLGSRVVNANGSTRTMNASQSLGFMQAWFPYSIAGHPVSERPPANVPRSVLTLNTRYGTTPQHLTIFYATNGKKSWVGMPPQNFGWAFVSSEKWIVAPEGTDLAFQGKVAPVLPTPTTTTTTTVPDPPASSSGGGGNSGLWVGLAIALVVVGGGGFVFARRKRSAA